MHRGFFVHVICSDKIPAFFVRLFFFILAISVSLSVAPSLAGAETQSQNRHYCTDWLAVPAPANLRIRVGSPLCIVEDTGVEIFQYSGMGAHRYSIE
jgi:hypothetical protein